MPAAPTAPSSPSPPPPVCVCGYDLAGLPEDAAAKCPECGVVVAEIVTPLPRFHHWGRWLAAGMTPAVCLGAAALTDAIIPGPEVGDGVASLFAVAGLVSWPFVSMPAFGVLVVRATRARSLAGGCAAVVLGVIFSLLANATVIVLVAMPFA